MNENVAPLWQVRDARRPGLPTTSDKGDLAELWLAARRQMWIVAFCALVGLSLASVHFATSPKQFYSSASILIEERQSDLDQEISSLRPLTRNETGFENQMQILSSTELATEVVRRLGLADNPDFLMTPTSMLGAYKAGVLGWIKSHFPEAKPTIATVPATPEQIAEMRIAKAAVRLAREATFARVGKSFSVEVGYTSHNPALAAAIANSYADAYLADGMEANTKANDRMSAWMRDRIEGLKLAALEASADAEKFRAQNGAMDQQGLREREQRVEALNDLYLTIEAQYQESLLAGSYPVANGRILSQAMVAEKPSEPKAWRLLLGGLVLGLMAGIGLAVLREMREKGFRTADDLRRVGLDFLGYLPVIGRREMQVDQRLLKMSRDVLPLPESDFSSSRSPYTAPSRSSRSNAALAPLLLHEPLSVSRTARDLMISVQHSATPYQLAVRNVLASIDLGLEDGRGRVIAVGGLVEGAGATTLAANLANLAASAGRRTLLIDGDLGRPDLTGRLDLEVSTNRADVLKPARAIRKLSETGLDVLPSIAPAGASSEAARVHSFRQVIATARNGYDLVFIDLPPLRQRPDAKSWLRQMDGIVLVVDWGKTSCNSLQSYLEHEPELQRRLLGAVLNRTKTAKLERYGVPALGHQAGA